MTMALEKKIDKLLHYYFSKMNLFGKSYYQSYAIVSISKYYFRLLKNHALMFSISGKKSNHLLNNFFLLFLAP